MQLRWQCRRHVTVWMDGESTLLHRRRQVCRNDARLFARTRGTDVVVLEKHAGFFRDFRGDTVHRSTLR